MEQTKENKMGTMPVNKLLVTMSLPMVISMIVQALYNIVDSIFVSRLSEDALTAVSMAFPMQNLMISVAVGTGVGINAMLSRALGEKKFEAANKTAENGIFIEVLGYVLFLLIGIFVTKPFFLAQAGAGDIANMGIEYTRICLLMSFGIFMQIGFERILQSTGRTIFTMITQSTGAIINIILDPILIFGLFGMPKMGVAGAALATIISQFVSFCLLIAGTFRGSNLRLNLRDFSPSLKYYQNIVKGGAPSLFRQGLGSFATVCLNLMAGPYGDAAIAAMSIVTRISQFAASVVIGFGQGFQPVCGFNYGAKLFKRVQEGFWFCVKFCTSVLLVAAVCGWIFSPNLIGIFLKTDPLVIEYGSQALRLQALTFPLVGWITIANMMLQTIGKTVKASLLAMSRQFLFFVPVILTLPGFLGILGVQFSQPIADFCSFLLAVPLSISVLREMSHEQEQLEQLKITREN